MRTDKCFSEPVHYSYNYYYLLNALTRIFQHWLKYGFMILGDFSEKSRALGLYPEMYGNYKIQQYKIIQNLTESYIAKSYLKTRELLDRNLFKNREIHKTYCCIFFLKNYMTL